jgi:hypothetical protein
MTTPFPIITITHIWVAPDGQTATIGLSNGKNVSFTAQELNNKRSPRPRTRPNRGRLYS